MNMNKNATDLVAFVLWNRLLNGYLARVKVSAYEAWARVFYWMAAITRYQMLIDSWADGILEDRSTNRKGGHSGGAPSGASGVAGAIKGFLIGIIIYFVAIAVVYTIGTSGIITNTLIQSQIKTAAYNMAVIGGLIGLIGGVLFLLKVLGGL